MTTDRTVTPLKDSIGEYSLNSDAMHVVEFRYEFYKPRAGFSRNRAVLKRIEPNRMVKEQVCAEIYATVRPCIAPDVRIDTETGNLLIRFINGKRFSQVRDELRTASWSRAHKFDMGIMCAVDLLLDASDRHGGNAMVLPKHIIPIDHEHTLPGGKPRVRPINKWAWIGLGWAGGRDTIGKSPAFRAGFERGLQRIEAKATRIARLMRKVDGVQATGPILRNWVAQTRKVAYSD